MSSQCCGEGPEHCLSSSSAPVTELCRAAFSLAWPWCSFPSDCSICPFLVPGLSDLYSVTAPQNKVFWVLNLHPQLCSESSSSPFSSSKDNWVFAKGTLCILCAREQRICEVATSGANSNGAGEATVWCGCKTSLSSVLSELYCYQSSSSCIWGSTLCRPFAVAAQIWPMPDYGQNAARQSSLVLVCIASASSLLFLFRRGRFFCAFLNM